MRHLVAALVVLSTSAAFAAETATARKWLVPPTRAAEKNPMPSTKGNTERGRQLFEQHCAMCHGEDGRGNGPRSGDLLRQMPAGATLDLRTPSVARDSDGALFYKIKMGRSPMPASTGPHGLNDDERWALVNYLRVIAPAGVR